MYSQPHRKEVELRLGQIRFLERTFFELVKQELQSILPPNLAENSFQYLDCSAPI